jgi:dihydrofolate reductase
MSLDGFIAGPDDIMDWISRHDAGPNTIAVEAIRSTGAILTGRRWYDLSTSRLGGIEEIYGGAWRGPVFVITHRPPVAPSNSALTFLTGSIDNAVATAFASAKGKNIPLWREHS